MRQVYGREGTSQNLCHKGRAPRSQKYALKLVPYQRMKRASPIVAEGRLCNPVLSNLLELSELQETLRGLPGASKQVGETRLASK